MEPREPTEPTKLTEPAGPAEPANVQGDPAKLVGECIEVEGLGVGTVEAFNKAVNKLLYDSKHVVNFSSGPQTVLLKRRKLGKWNGGLEFKVVTRDDALDAEPAFAGADVAADVSYAFPIQQR